MTSLDRWQIQKAEDGFRLTFEGVDWPMAPRDTWEACNKYKKSVERRIPDWEARAQIRYARKHGVRV